MREAQRTNGLRNKRHGYAGRVKHCLYVSWESMKARCTDRKAATWPRYGGRGISFDPRWRDFEAFLADIGDTWFQSAELHRRDGNANYFKGNCVWLTASKHDRVHWASYTLVDRLRRIASARAGIHQRLGRSVIVRNATFDRVIVFDATVDVNQAA